MIRIGIVAGETSGDYLAAGLIRSLKKSIPQLKVEGIGGPLMMKEGFISHYSMETISIMGFEGLFKNLRRILRIRADLLNRFLANPPDLFIGVDVPDFNLTLEAKLKRSGIHTIHYVSPTVWAWREYRLRKIRKAVSHMLTLFPFESEYYERQRIPVTYIGHPIADEIPLKLNKSESRKKIGVSAETIIALLPGSRSSELKQLGQLFIDVARRVHKRYPQVIFLAPFANEKTQIYFENLLSNAAKDLPIRVIQGQSREVLAASDIALLASGTAALEAALYRVPMIVAYKVSIFTSLLVRMFARVKYFSMPNHLLSEPIIPELLQSQASVDRIELELRRLLDDEKLRSQISRRLEAIPEILRCNANDNAAKAVLSYIREHSGAVVSAD